MSLSWYSFSAPHYSAPDDSLIDVSLVLAEGAPAIPYSAGRVDAVSSALYAAVVATGGVVAYSAPPRTLVAQAADGLRCGFSITLSGSVTLAATKFPIDPVSHVKLGAVVTTLTATGAFPGGATSWPMKDCAGVWHTFGIAPYKAVASAIAAYIAALYLIMDGNPLGAVAIPAPSATLAV